MLKIQAVTRIFPNGTQALAPVSLDADGGEIIAVVGGSGCGKSTLLRIASGLDRPTAGKVSVDGETIAAPHPYVGIVFQEPRLLPWLSVSENVGFGLSDVTRAERARRVDQVLTHVGLPEYGTRWPKELSGGQRSAWHWLGSSSPVPARSSWMNRSRHSMPSRASRCTISFGRSMRWTVRH